MPLLIAKAASIPARIANEIINELRATVGRWPAFASEAGLLLSRLKEPDRILNSR